MSVVAVDLYDVITDEGDKTPVQGVHAGRRHDEPVRGHQPLPQLLSRLVSHASHPSRCRGDGKYRTDDLTRSSDRVIFKLTNTKYKYKFGLVERGLQIVQGANKMSKTNVK